MNKKKMLELVGSVCAWGLFLWGVFSVLEIGMRNPFTGGEINSMNLVIIMFDLFGGVR